MEGGVALSILNQVLFLNSWWKTEITAFCFWLEISKVLKGTRPTGQNVPQWPWKAAHWSAAVLVSLCLLADLHDSHSAGGSPLHPRNSTQKALIFVLKLGLPVELFVTACVTTLSQTCSLHKVHKVPKYNVALLKVLEPCLKLLWGCVCFKQSHSSVLWGSK